MSIKASTHSERFKHSFIIDNIGEFPAGNYSVTITEETVLVDRVAETKIIKRELQAGSIIVVLVEGQLEELLTLDRSK